MLRVMTYNIRDGGVDDDGSSRLDVVHSVVREAAPDILAIQEANEFDLRSYRRLFAFEQATGLRGFLGLSRSGYHGAVFVQREYQPLALRIEDGVGNRPIIELRLRIGESYELSVCSVHLNPISAEMRLAGILHATVAPPAIVMGDFNAYRMDDPYAAEALARFSPRHRARAESTGVGDRLFTVLEDAGFVDLYRQARPGESGYTIAAAGGLRLDYIFASADLAACARRCDVISNVDTERASDHSPVVADLDLDLDLDAHSEPSSRR